jgi:hypothetical protein
MQSYRDRRSLFPRTDLQFPVFCLKPERQQVGLFRHGDWIKWAWPLYSYEFRKKSQKHRSCLTQFDPTLKHKDIIALCAKICDFLWGMLSNTKSSSLLPGRPEYQFIDCRYASNAKRELKGNAWDLDNKKNTLPIAGEYFSHVAVR